MIMEQMAVVVSAGIPGRGNSHKVQGLSLLARSSVMLTVGTAACCDCQPRALAWLAYIQAIALVSRAI